MGDETREFAVRFVDGTNHLALLVKDDTFADLKKAHGPDLAPLVRDALDGVEAIFGTGTQAVRNWPEKRATVLAQVTAMREALGSGVTPEVRRMARDLVLLIEPKAAELVGAPPKRR